MTKYTSFLHTLLGFQPTNRAFALALFNLYYKDLDSQRDHFQPERDPQFGISLALTGAHIEQVVALRKLSFAELGEKAADFDALYADAVAELVSKDFFRPHPFYSSRYQPTDKTKKIVETVGEFARKFVSYRSQKATAAELDDFQAHAEALATEKRAELLNGTLRRGETFFHVNASRFPLMRRLDDEYKRYARSESPFGFLPNAVLSEAR